MSFREWLPITTRNRVALGLAALALPLFVVWNCLPDYDYPFEAGPCGIIGMSLWRDQVFSPELYVMVFKDPDMEGFLIISAFMALIQNAIVTFAAVPFWKILHASPYIRLPLAIVNLLGGCVILRHFCINQGNTAPFLGSALLLMALGMFAVSASLFLFKNELELRSQRMISNNHRP